MNNKYNIVYILCIILFLIYVFQPIFEGFHKKNEDYHIVCANYDKSVDFLQGIEMPNTIIKKGTDVPNKANEATSYLHYIISNYENLPNNIVFIHDEDESWHHKGKISENIYEWIKSYEDNGKKYYEFNNVLFHKNGTNMPKNLYDENPVFKKYWDQCLRKNIGDYSNAIPEEGKCCAQFIVSRNKILQKPKEFYVNMYNWFIENTHGEGNGDKENLNSSFNTGRYAEWTWRFIFSDKNV